MAPGTKFVLNQNIFTVLSSELAICDSIVGVFNCLWLPEDDFDYDAVTDEEYEKMLEETPFDYESSLLKQWVDNWFENEIMPYLK